MKDVLKFRSAIDEVGSLFKQQALTQERLLNRRQWLSSFDPSERAESLFASDIARKDIEKGGTLIGSGLTKKRALEIIDSAISKNVLDKETGKYFKSWID